MSDLKNTGDKTNSVSPLGVRGQKINIMEMTEERKQAHPCFNEEAKHTNARVHLP